MSPDRWPEVERLYHAALELPPEARDAFLGDACAGDRELRDEVAALLARDDAAADFIEAPALELAARLEAREAGSAAALDVVEPTEVIEPPAGSRPWAAPRPALVLVAALASALAAAGWKHLAARGVIDSLAVLPFECARQDPDVADVSDALTGRLIDEMSRVASMRVPARAAVLRFKGAADPQAAGRELGVRAVVTGTVSRRGDRISIAAELVEVSSGARLWGEKYERPGEDLRHLPGGIAAEIAQGLRARLSRADRGR